MKKARTLKIPEHPALLHDLPHRLAELETELRRHSGRKAKDRALSTIQSVGEATIGPHKVIQFEVAEKAYAAGHSDVTYQGTNHARGIRHIRFYDAGTMVLDIEGDFEDQQLGSNFQFKSVTLYQPGEWETMFIKLTDRLRHHTAERKSAFHKKRAAEILRRG